MKDGWQGLGTHFEHAFNNQLHREDGPAVLWTVKTSIGGCKRTGTQVGR